MVEVFKTNITHQLAAEEVINELKRSVPVTRVNFDLHDCDRILRVEAHHIPVTQIIGILRAMGHYCEVLQ